MYIYSRQREKEMLERQREKDIEIREQSFPDFPNNICIVH